MTNDEQLAEAREFLATPNLGKDMARELDKALIYIRRLADALEAAMIPHAECEASGERAGAQLADLKAALEAAEARVKELEAGVEWEYGYRSTRTGNRWGSGSLLDAQLGAKAISAKIERRRKPGPWMPVESEGTND